ncbi:MAG: hypothetical protein LBR83_06305 [Clostridiales bacterium]|jgi:hypothetical protein|nr:hypothetical protein [Clostridiales bacterium]
MNWKKMITVGLVAGVLAVTGCSNTAPGTKRSNRPSVNATYQRNRRYNANTLRNRGISNGAINGNVAVSGDNYRADGNILPAGNNATGVIGWGDSVIKGWNDHNRNANGPERSYNRPRSYKRGVTGTTNATRSYERNITSPTGAAQSYGRGITAPTGATRSYNRSTTGSRNTARYRSGNIPSAGNNYFGRGYYGANNHPVTRFNGSGLSRNRSIAPSARFKTGRRFTGNRNLTPPVTGLTNGSAQINRSEANGTGSAPVVTPQKKNVSAKKVTVKRTRKAAAPAPKVTPAPTAAPKTVVAPAPRYSSHVSSFRYRPKSYRQPTRPGDPRYVNVDALIKALEKMRDVQYVKPNRSSSATANPTRTLKPTAVNKRKTPKRAGINKATRRIVDSLTRRTKNFVRANRSSNTITNTGGSVIRKQAPFANLEPMRKAAELRRKAAEAKQARAPGSLKPAPRSGAGRVVNAPRAPRKDISNTKNIPPVRYRATPDRKPSVNRFSNIEQPKSAINKIISRSPAAKDTEEIIYK